MIIIYLLVIAASFFYFGTRYERHQNILRQEKARLRLIETYFGFTLSPGETVEELSARTTQHIKFPFKEARENPAWVKK